MSFVGDMFSSSKGAGFQANSEVTPDQIAKATGDAGTATNYARAFADALNAANGVGKQNAVFADQQALAKRLAAGATGGAPSVAQARLKQATDANVKNTAALLASQKGMSPGTAARLIAQQGADTEQQAAGEAATLGVQEQQGYIGALEQQQAAMAGVAGQQVGQQADATKGLTGAADTEQKILLDANANANAANAGVAGINAKGQQQILGGVIGGAGTALGLAKGGAVPAAGPISRVAQFLSTTDTGAADPLASGVSSLIGGAAKAAARAFAPSPRGDIAGDQGEGAPGPVQYAAKGGKVKAMLSPGEEYLPPGKAKAVARGKASPMSGKKVPGKAKVEGDSLKNDTVPAKLEPGGVVIPRSIMQSDDAANKAKKFVEAVLARQMKRRAA